MDLSNPNLHLQYLFLNHFENNRPFIQSLKFLLWIILQDYQSAITYASKVLEFCPESYEALWAVGKAKKEFGEVKEVEGNCNIELLESALADLRNAIRLAPQNLELHR